MKTRAAALLLALATLASGHGARPIAKPTTKPTAAAVA